MKTVYIDCPNCGAWVALEDDWCPRCAEWFKPGELRARLEREHGQPSV